MNKRFKTILFVVAVAVAVFLLAAALFILTFDINAYKPRIEAALSKATKMEVRIGALRLTLLPDAGIAARNIVLKNGGERVASAEEMRMQMGLLPLVRREMRIRRLVLVSPEFVVARNKEGRYNFETGGAKTEGPSGVKALELRMLRVRGGHLLYRDAESGRNIEAEGCDLELRDLSGEGGDPWRTISFAGDVACREVRTGGVNASEFRAGLKAGGGKYLANPVAMKIYGGEGRGSVAVEAAARAPLWSVDVSDASLRFEEVLAAFGEKKDIRGQLNLTAHLAMEGKSGDEMRKTARGEISIRGRDLAFERFDLDRLLEKYDKSQSIGLVEVGGFFIIGPLSSLLTKGYEFGDVYTASRGGKSTIRRLVSDWTIKNGTAEAKDAAFVTDRNRVAMKGGLDFVRDRYENVTVAVLNAKGCAVYSQKIQGPFSRPIVEKPSMISSFLNPVISLLKKPVELLAGEKCEVFYRGSLPQPAK